MSQQTPETSAAPRRPRIAIIGPTEPYRTGIAQYTTQLQHALSAHADVQAVSFSRQYPGWLYPGGSDYKLQPDMKREADVRYSIDVYNPLSWRRSVDEIVQNGCDMAVLDWWTLFWQPGFTYMARRLRKKGVKVTYLCHNLFNHRTAGVMGLIDMVMSRVAIWMLRQADAYVVQSSEEQAQLEAIKPGAEILFRPHPVYNRFPPATRKLAKRGRLELLFFGIIRPYKGLDILLESLGKLQDHEVYLTVAGEAWGDTAALQAQFATADVPNLETHIAFISDDKVADYFEQADVVVAPYRSATGSGVVAVAYHYGKPVIATSVGGLKDVVIEGKTGWLVPPESSDALAEAITRITRTAAEQMKPNIEAFCRANSWDAVALAICELADMRTA